MRYLIIFVFALSGCQKATDSGVNQQLKADVFIKCVSSLENASSFQINECKISADSISRCTIGEKDCS